MDSCYSTWLATSHNVSTRCLCTWTAENSKAKLHTQGHPELSSTAGRWFCHSLFSPHRSSPSLFSSFLPTVSLHALSRCVHPSLHLKNLKVEVISLHPHHLDPPHLSCDSSPAIRKDLSSYSQLTPQHTLISSSSINPGPHFLVVLSLSSIANFFLLVPFCHSIKRQISEILNSNSLILGSLYFYFAV